MQAEIRQQQFPAFKLFRLIVEMIFFDVPVKGLAVDAEQAGRFGLVPCCLLEGLEDLLPIDAFPYAVVGTLHFPKGCELRGEEIGGLVFDRRVGMFFNVNPTGFEIINLMGVGLSRAAILSRLSRFFEGAPDRTTVLADFADFEAAIVAGGVFERK